MLSPTYQQRAYKLSELPILPGIAKLNDSEIFADLRELHRSTSPQGTDAESSVATDEVLSSTYPVKPRKVIRVGRIESQSNSGSSDSLSAEVHEALKFLQNVQRNNAEVYALEQQREDIEITMENYNRQYENKLQEFLEMKNEEETYLRLLQGILLRSLRVHSNYSQYNSLIWRVYDALRSRRKNQESIETALNQYKTPNGTRSRSNSMTKEVGSGFAPVQVLMVKSRSSTGVLSENSLCLLTGQVVQTPYGEGKILSFNKDELKARLQLGFGEMFCTLNQLSEWKWAELLGTSVKGVVTQWKSEMQHAVSMSEKEWKRMHTALRSGDSTDVEENTGSESVGVEEREDSASMEEEVEEEEDVEAEAEAEIDGEIEAELDAELAEETEAVEDGDKDSGEGEDGVAGNDKEGEGGRQANLNNVSSGGRRGKGGKRRGGKRASAAMMELGANAGPVTWYSDGGVSVPLKVEENGRRFRGELLQHLEDRVAEKRGVLDSSLLPIAVAPPASLSKVIKQLRERKELSVLDNYGDFRYEMSALEEVPEDSLLGSTGSFGWTGEVSKLSSEQTRLEEEFRLMKEEEKRMVTLLEQTRAETMRLSAQTSTLRLSMFTRRIAHRNYLADKGIVIHYPVQSNKGGGGGKGAGSSGNNKMSGVAAMMAAAANLISAAEGSSVGTSNGAPGGNGVSGGGNNKDRNGRWANRGAGNRETSSTAAVESLQGSGRVGGNGGQNIPSSGSNNNINASSGGRRSSRGVVNSNNTSNEFDFPSRKRGRDSGASVNINNNDDDVDVADEEAENDEEENESSTAAPSSRGGNRRKPGNKRSRGVY